VVTSKNLKEHVPEESVFRHELNVKKPEEETGRIIGFDHKIIEHTDVGVILAFNHKQTPELQMGSPRITELGRHEFTVQRPVPPSLHLIQRKLEAQTIVKKTFIEDIHNPFITYYGPVGGSFGIVARQHMENLPRVGWNVNWVDLGRMAESQVGYSAGVGILHPVLYWGIIKWQTVQGWKHLRQVHNKLLGFEVADSDAISETAMSTINELDLLMVPSEAAKNAFVSSGAKIPVEVVQHGVSPNYNVPKQRLSVVPDGVNILFFELHSRWRKGTNIVWKVMKRILNERTNVNFMVRTRRGNALLKLPRTKHIRWLSEPDLVRLYDSCDILLAPSRGGAFELNPLEALARGLIVVSSECPAIKEYAKEALYIKSKGQVQPLPTNPIHIGKGPDPDPEHAYELVNYAIDNLEMLKKKAEQEALKIRQKYTWRKAAMKIADILGRL